MRHAIGRIFKVRVLDQILPLYRTAQPRPFAIGDRTRSDKTVLSFKDKIHRPLIRRHIEFFLGEG